MTGCRAISLLSGDGLSAWLAALMRISDFPEEVDASGYVAVRCGERQFLRAQVGTFLVAGDIEANALEIGKN